MNAEKSASNLEHRDSTGLITTSKLEDNKEQTTFVLSARYPLLGGWKNSFEINYNFPLDNVIQQIGGQKRFALPLKVDFDGIVENGEIDVVLPEGSTVTSITIPKRGYISQTTFEQKSFGTIYTKPVVKISLKDVDMGSLTESVEIYYKENPAAETTKNVIVACLASSIILIIILYAKIINN